MAFARKREEAHAWIRNFYRLEVISSELPVVYETTGMSDRKFHEELSVSSRLFYVKVVTSRKMCTDRVQSRPKGKHTNAMPDTVSDFYDHWYSEIEHTYQFDLSVDGTDTDKACRRIHQIMGRVA